MSDEALRAVASRAGVLPRWKDAFGVEHDVPPETLRAVLGRIGVPAGSEAELRDAGATLDAAGGHAPLVTADVGVPVSGLPSNGRWRIALEDGGTSEGTGTLPAIDVPGYHAVEFADGTAVTVAVAPADCTPLPARAWGLAVQLYALRGAVDGGVGDFSALAEMARAAGARGAAALAISPVHAQFSADPDRFSPYAPSSRIMLNVLHAALPDGVSLPAGGDLVDWPEVARARLSAMRAAFDADGEAAALTAFRAERGDALEGHARFEALHAHLFAGGRGPWHWRDWPAELRHPASLAVAAFARANGREVAFHAWLQMQADRGLAAAQAAARAAGMGVGLISDLAVGTDSGGSHCWSRQDQVLVGLTVGAPPDLLSPGGQDWGLSAFSPLGLRAHGFGAFIEMLRAALRHAGGVRIDHIMGLARLWVLPEGARASEGAYLTMPRDDLLRLVALESRRYGAIVVGEDLGTLPDGFQEALRARAIGGLRVLWFERAKDEGFIAPAHWSAEAVAMTSTHDLPTVAGWWTGHDLDLRAAIGHMRDEAVERAGRVADRARLWSAMTASGAVCEGAAVPASSETDAVVDAAVAHVGRAACGLALLPIEDAIGTVEQPNLPGTMDEHPNWRRRLSGTAEQLLSAPAVEQRLSAFARARTLP